MPSRDNSAAAIRIMESSNVLKSLIDLKCRPKYEVIGQIKVDCLPSWNDEATSPPIIRKAVEIMYLVRARQRDK